jgi:ribosome-associated protein
VTSSSVLRAVDRQRLLERLGPSVAAASDDERSQLRNRRVAHDRLRRALLEALRPPVPRRPTRPTRGSVEARLAAKRRQAGRKADRRPPPAD